LARKEYKQFKIIRDTREKKGNGWNFRASANCVGMELKKLDTGDYSIEGCEHLIMLERKSISDLWMSLTSERERFLREMDRAKLIPARYLIIEGTLRDVMAGISYSKVRPEFILASLTSLEIKYGIHVVFTDKRNDIAQQYVRKLLEKLFQYCEDGVISGRPINPE
jgi:ERCC4-type nuclease